MCALYDPSCIFFSVLNFRLVCCCLVADGDKEQVQAFVDQHHAGTDLHRSLLLPLPSAELVSGSVNSPSSVLLFWPALWVSLSDAAIRCKSGHHAYMCVTLVPQKWASCQYATLVTVQEWPSRLCVTLDYSVEMSAMCVCYAGPQCRNDHRVHVLHRVTVWQWPSCLCVTLGYSVEMTTVFVCYSGLQCRNDHHVFYAGSVHKWPSCLCYTRLQFRNDHWVWVLHWITV